MAWRLDRYTTGARGLWTWRSVVVVAFIPWTSTACTSFSSLRSAEVRPGPSLAAQVSATSLPGDVAGWFWSLDCETACDHPIVGGDLGVAYGWRKGDAARGFELGAGTSGTHPYIDAYVQLAAGRRPFGIGARVGPPVTNWREHQVYARYDVPLGRRRRLLLNPIAFLHEGASPNGENPGTFIAFVQGVGILFAGERVSWTPGLSLVAGRAERTSYGQRFGPTSSVFGTASFAVTLHR